MQSRLSLPLALLLLILSTSYISVLAENITVVLFQAPLGFLFAGLALYRTTGQAIWGGIIVMVVNAYIGHRLLAASFRYYNEQQKLIDARLRLTTVSLYITILRGLIISAGNHHAYKMGQVLSVRNHFWRTHQSFAKGGVEGAQKTADHQYATVGAELVYCCFGIVRHAMRLHTSR